MKVNEVVVGPLARLGSYVLKKYGDDAIKAYQRGKKADEPGKALIKKGDDVAKKADEPEIIPPGQVSKSAANPAAERKTADILGAFKQFKKDGTMPADTPMPTTGDFFRAAGKDPDKMQAMIRAYRAAKGLK